MSKGALQLGFRPAENRWRATFFEPRDPHNDPPHAETYFGSVEGQVAGEGRNAVERGCGALDSGIGFQFVASVFLGGNLLVSNPPEPGMNRFRKITVPRTLWGVEMCWRAIARQQISPGKRSRR